MIPYPDVKTLSDYQKNYILNVPAGMHLVEALEYSHKELINGLSNISEEQSTFAYQPGKWSIKKLVVHITDSDRVFQYRALSIARGAKENLPSFDENEFADHSNADQLSFASILEEYESVAKTFQLLYANIDPEKCLMVGTANSTKVTPAIIGFLTAGHRLHHLKVLRDKYKI